MPKVSICIPAYQQVKFLRKTLSSVLEQTFTNYELIVTDDSPDDSVKSLLNEFDFKGKLSYFKNTPGLGSPANWNCGIQKSNGEYIKILHHDDFFTSSESLQKYVNLLDENPKAAFAFSGTTIQLLALNTTKKNNCTNKQLRKIIAHPNELFFANHIGAPSAVIIKNDKTILFDVQLKWLVDVDWYIQLIKNNPNIICTQETLICTVHGAEGQITQSVFDDKNIQIKEHVYLFEKLFNDRINVKKYSVFFQLLFHKYSINNVEQLDRIYPVPQVMRSFFSEVFDLKNKNIFLKKVMYWLKKKSFNDHLFTLKSRFK